MSPNVYLIDCHDLPLNIVAEIHGNEQLVGQQRGFCRGCPNYETERQEEGRQLLDEPSKPGVHWKSIFAGSISPVWHIFKKQSNESADSHENHEVSQAVQHVELLFLRGEEGGEESVHHDRRVIKLKV